MPATATARPAEDLRRRLLDASLDLIANEGLESFSMREVARRAGVSHQAPYHHFPDREAILAAIVAEGFERLRAETAAARDAESDPLRRLTAIGKTYVAFARANPAHFKLMFRSEWVKAEKHEEAAACAGSAFAVLQGSIEEAKDALGDRDPAMLMMAWSMAHGLATLMLEGKLGIHCGEGEADQQAAVDAVFDSFEKRLRL